MRLGLAGQLAATLFLFSGATAGADSEAPTYIHAAAEAPAPVLIDARLIAGFDWEMTALESGGFGLRAGAYWSPLVRTRLQLWASETGGGSLCRDGIASSSSNPFFGCYPLNSTSLGVSARQGLLRAGRFELGVEAGVSARTVPAMILIIGLGERLTVEGSVSFSAITLYTRVGAGLSEVPSTGDVYRVLIVGAGIEGAIGHFRPSFEVTANRVDLVGWPQSTTGPMLSLGLGYAF